MASVWEFLTKNLLDIVTRIIIPIITLVGGWFLAHLYHRPTYGDYIFSDESYGQISKFVMGTTSMAQIHDVMISTSQRS